MFWLRNKKIIFPLNTLNESPEFGANFSYNLCFRLANKQDIPHGMDDVEICEKLHLEDVVNSNKCPCKMVRRWY